MRKNTYVIQFEDDSSVEIWAFTSEQAKILAQAEKIKRGEPFGIIFIEKTGFVPE